MIPLSFPQLRLWFIQQMEGPNATHNVPLVLRLKGSLNTPALRAAIDDIVDRHEALRTLLVDTDGVPQQLILGIDEAKVPFDLVPVRENDLPGVLESAIHHPFDLAREIPLRVSLFELGSNDHVVLLLMHHSGTDAWSFSPLMRYLSEAYAARV